MSAEQAASVRETTPVGEAGSAGEGVSASGADGPEGAPEQQDAARLLVRTLEAEGVEYVFGIPGEENIHFVHALNESSIRYVLVRHEQGAAFMAEIYGRLTGRAGVASATLGPGAINLQLGVADATTNSTPVVAISAQVGLDRIYKESHQIVDLVSLFRPITKWSELAPTAEALPEMVRKAFKTAQTERPGAVYLAIPEDVESAKVAADLKPLKVNVVRPQEPSASQIARAADVIALARQPIILAGHGAARAGAGEALVHFSELLGLPVATTFNGKGVFPDDHRHALGAVGFMRHDYVNFGFDEADVLIAVGYELQEFDPVKINPAADKKIIHIHQFPAEVDDHYPVEVGIQGDLSRSLHALAEAVHRRFDVNGTGREIRRLMSEELAEGAVEDGFPLSPRRIVADVRAAMGRDDIVLADTGAVKMWMARMYPTYEPNTLLVSNGLSSMGFAVPGAIAAKLARPDRRVLAATGDGAFLMNSQELETAVRENIPITVLIWDDSAYGLIEWKMDLDMGTSSHVKFGNPDFVKYAESFGARGYRVGSAGELLPTLRKALADDAVSVITVPVDYSHNLRLTDKLGELTDPF
ncbi:MULTISPECIES: acetolactate synthase large subunit [Actinomadura]|uniref:Acetolactate synthase large subunit n=1 Tax=Actinomadura litoris TaxID=2678616 RepID=A0A7K1L3C4_9ACTN|nr:MULTISPECIES: acetolactate synthase large subunit [Actinomadura]MBT2208663.1 acetolactate synthase large subunit [Actinomadura sp. NEAU-AAG7]MUN38765.1 acetolactate synthase large subunit [Actinomadura litoris]